ncbi:MAG: hypothetical protein V3W18_12785 [candidate division Zixibacteria bacterium]
MNKYFSKFRELLLIICLVSLSALTPARGQNCDFRLLPQEVTLSLAHTKYLELGPKAEADGNMLFFIRQKSPLFPGDYFRPPLGAEASSISDSDKAIVDSILHSYIKSFVVADHILSALNGYEYMIAQGTVRRREFHVSYACADTIYVVSGWIGKFISYYKAVPGSFRHNVNELQDEIVNLSNAYKIHKRRSFKRIDDEKNYLLEYIDKEDMIRVRNYLITGSNIFGISLTEGASICNLIEITKFIDPEVIP